MTEHDAQTREEYTREEYIEWIAEELDGAGLAVERIGDTLNVRHGEGRRAFRANLGLEAILAELFKMPEDEHDRLVAGYTRGVCGVMLEPAISRAIKGWEYRAAAARLMPSIEVYTFALGVADTQEFEAWTAPFVGDLIMTYVIEQDRGYRVLSRAQVDAWGASDDRVVSAGRSMLYHKTREAAQLRPLDGARHVRQVKVGDGYDAARATVLPDVFFHDLEEQHWRFAIPNPDLLLFIDSPDPSALAELRRIAEDIFDESDFPLSDQLYGSVNSRPYQLDPSLGA